MTAAAEIPDQGRRPPPGMERTMLEATLQHLKEHGYVRGEEQVDRAGLAGACATRLLTDPVTTDNLDEVQEKALLATELRYQLLGAGANEEVEAELDDVIATLTGPRGQVQDRLENGYVLCSAQVVRKLSNNGEGVITLKRTGRFVTGNPDLIERFFWQPAHDRLLAAAKGLKGRIELSVRRQPELVARSTPALGRAQEQLVVELTAEAES
jgi:hypothetical protein